MIYKILAFAIGISCAPAAMSQVVESGDREIISAIPNVEISYYDVGGDNELRIRDSINKLRPDDPIEKKPYDALANYNFGWGWPVYSDGKCDLESASLVFKANITLPRLTTYAEINPKLQARWDIFMAALKDRQMNRVSIAYSQKDNLLAVIKGATCDTANNAANGYLVEIFKLAREYLKRETRARREAVSFP